MTTPRLSPGTSPRYDTDPRQQHSLRGYAPLSVDVSANVVTQGGLGNTYYLVMVAS